MAHSPQVGGVGVGWRRRSWIRLVAAGRVDLQRLGLHGPAKLARPGHRYRSLDEQPLMRCENGGQWPCAATPLAGFLCPTRRPVACYPFTSLPPPNYTPAAMVAKSDYAANGGDVYCSPGSIGLGPAIAAMAMVGRRPLPLLVWRRSKLLIVRLCSLPPGRAPRAREL